MDKVALQGLIVEKLGARPARLGLRASEITADLDLVRSGVLDSLGFVDLITELETAVGKQVEFEKAFDRPGATTVGGVIDLFLNDR
ncbi:MAG: acyl carrier protein [Flavobacteriales bacterium]